MTKKLLSCLFLVMAVMLIGVPVSAEASGGTVISTVVPQKYSSTLNISDGVNVEYDGVIYKDGDTIQVTEGADLTFRLRVLDGYKLKSVSYNGQDIKDQVSDDSITIKNVQQNGTLVVTYTKIGSVITPATGDKSHIWLWTMLALGSMGILAILVLKNKKSKHS